MWKAFKIGLAVAMTVTMMWHWQVVEAQAEPFLVASDGNAEPAETIFYAERIPDGHWKDLGMFRSTGYCNCRRCCGKWAGGPTKSGVMPVEGETIAVDPKVIPLGSMVMVDGKIYWAQDTGSGINGKRIDIYYEDHGRASDHGIQKQHVFVWVPERRN